MLELSATQSGKQISDTYNAVARRQNCTLRSSDRFRDKVADIVERVVATRRSCQWHIDNRKILDLSATCRWVDIEENSPMGIGHPC